MSMHKGKLLELLRKHPMMASLSEDQLLHFAQAGELEAFEPKEVVVTTGSLGDALYLVLEGRARVNGDGRIKQARTELGSGEFFGELSLVEATARTATVTAKDKLLLFRIPRQELQRLAEEDPRGMNRVLIVILKTLSARFRRVNDTLNSIIQLNDWIATTII